MQDFFVCQRSGSWWGPRAATGAAPTLSQARGCRGTRPACAFQVVFALFSLCITSYYHSFATAICPIHQHMFFITLSSLASAQHLRLPSWDTTVRCDEGRGRQTGAHLQCRPGGFHHTRAAHSSAQPRSGSSGLCCLVATKEGRGKGPGSDNGPRQSRSTGPVWGSSCPSSPLLKHLPQADRSTRPLTLLWPQRRKVLFVPAGWEPGRGFGRLLLACLPAHLVPAPMLLPARSFQC